MCSDPYHTPARHKPWNAYYGFCFFYMVVHMIVAKKKQQLVVCLKTKCRRFVLLSRLSFVLPRTADACVVTTRPMHDMVRTYPKRRSWYVTTLVVACDETSRIRSTILQNFRIFQPGESKQRGIRKGKLMWHHFFVHACMPSNICQQSTCVLRALPPKLLTIKRTTAGTTEEPISSCMLQNRQETGAVMN